MSTAVLVCASNWGSPSRLNSHRCLPERSSRVASLMAGDRTSGPVCVGATRQVLGIGSGQWSLIFLGAIRTLRPFDECRVLSFAGAFVEGE